MSGEVLLAVNNISKKYGQRLILDELSLRIHKGECVIVRGSNGSGKSTLLKIMTGLLPHCSGERILSSKGLVVGYTPDYLPRLRMTSTEYLTHMGKLSKLHKSVLQERIEQLHQLFNLDQSSMVKMTHFSKGMLQKVNLMQATLHDPDLLVLDEPFSGLDKDSEENLLAALQKLQAEGTAIMAAVHDPLLANQLENRTYWLQEGKLRETLNHEVSLTGSFNEENCYVFELLCQLTDRQQLELQSQFPSIVWRRGTEQEATCTIEESHYYSFMMELVQREIPIITLQRVVITL